MAVHKCSDGLYHHGIKGMKWGVRRFQNADGSLTAKGKQRYGDKDNFEKQYPEDVKKTINKVGTSMGKANKAVNKAKDVNDKMVKKANQEKIKDDVSKLSDQELQKIVNRLNMEERYKQVMNSRATENGKNRVGEVLEYAGMALTVGASAVSLYMQMQQLKNKK